MKKIVGFILLIALLVSCTPKDEFTIKGTVSGRDLNGNTINFYRYDENFNFEADSTVIKNNKFKIQGISKEPAVFYAYIDAPGVYGDIARGVPVLIKPGKITLDIKGDEVIIGGNEENIQYQELIDNQKPIREKEEELIQKFEASDSEEEKKQIQKEYFELNEVSKKDLTSYIYKNINNPLGKDLFLAQFNLFTLDQVKELLSMTDESFSSRQDVMDLVAFMTPKGKFAKGTKYLDFRMKDEKGRDVSLSNYIGKGNYILVHFWAAASLPSTQEIPDLVAFYNEIKNEKFEIVGVSLDQNKEEWLKAIREYKMAWPQLIDDFQAADAVEAYNLSHIPYTILIDPDGNIVADGLTGQELEETILHEMKIPHTH